MNKQTTVEHTGGAGSPGSLPLDDVRLPLELPADRRFQIIGFGENAVDWICRVPQFPAPDSKVRMERMLQMGGGQIATACSMCARYGLRTRYVGRIGDDELGRFLERDLGSEPMDIQLDVVPGAFSHHSLIIVDRPTGSRTIIFDRDARLRYSPGELRRELLVEGQILHADGNDLEASVQAARWAREAGMKVCIDIDRVQPGVEDLVAVTDLLIASRSFVEGFGGRKDWRKNLLHLSQVCPGLVGMTRGELGAALVWDGTIVEFPAFCVEVVDSTGAGDMFHGGFLYALLQGWSLGRCVRFANAAGALACTRLGARAGIPALEEVLQLERSGILRT
ncbi:MAG: sugar kinase [Acidobacteriota bacterium]